MKKYLLIFLCCSSSFLQCTTTVIVEREKKITPYSVQWLYELYEQSPDYIITKEVHENLPYFRQMMHSYVKTLSLAIERQNTLAAKSVVKNVTGLAAVSALLGGGGWMLHQSWLANKQSSYNCDQDFKIGGYMIGGVFSALTGLALLPESILHTINTITFKQRLAYRYEVGKKILEQLEQADNTVY